MNEHQDNLVDAAKSTVASDVVESKATPNLNVDPVTFAAIERERAALLTAKTERVKEHADWLLRCECRIKWLSEREALLGVGLDLDRIDRAQKIIQITGDPTKPVHGSDRLRTDTRTHAISEAKQWLAESPDKLKKHYIGIKNYAHFGDQREDHQYGMGPKHGDIVFSVGLTREARNRELTDAEIEDALYLLHILPQAMTAKSAMTGNQQ